MKPTPKMMRAMQILQLPRMVLQERIDRELAELNANEIDTGIDATCDTIHSHENLNGEDVESLKPTIES